MNPPAHNPGGIIALAPYAAARLKNGRGVALATALGMLVGANLVRPDANPLPVVR